MLDGSAALDGSATLDAELVLALRELLSRIHVGLTTSDVPLDAERVLAFVELRREDGFVEVAFEDARAHTTFVRRIEATGSAALLRETVAHVILGLVEPLVRAAPEVPVATVEPPGPEPAQNVAKEAPRQRAAPGVQLALAGGALRVADKAWGARLALDLSTVFATRLRPALGLRLGGVVPQKLAQHGVDARFALLSARAFGGISALRGRRAALDVELSLGSDLLSMQPRRADAATALHHNSLRAQPIVGAALSLRTALVAWLSLFVRVGLDVDLHPRVWVIEDKGAEQVFFAPSRLRPYASLGFLFELLPARDRGAS